ncbi:MAG: hypothetical protein AMJ43_05520 [Coxiella sp. DG_40]|nr:MAG: hypothetical protein AMJ43_05520 [Coxiella sp. DG_40]
MKSLSMFNKPVTEADNKQSGQTFMELVIILLISGTAVICIIWYFYWVLQGMLVDLKNKLELIKAGIGTQCGLPAPHEVIQGWEQPS